MYLSVGGMGAGSTRWLAAARQVDLNAHAGGPVAGPNGVFYPPGWNLVAATYPNPGLMTDSIYNQIEAESGACTAAILTNAACNPTVTQIKTLGAGGQSHFQHGPRYGLQRVNSSRGKRKPLRHHVVGQLVHLHVY